MTKKWIFAALLGVGLAFAQTAWAKSILIKVDGSSTVFPITEAVAEEFQKKNAGVRVTVGISGTGGGFKKFCAGETDLSDASRPIKLSDKEIHLFGPGADSGTYDYFTEAIVGKEHSSRGDFTASEDDNVLVQGIASDQYALGFFGVAYYQENKDRLKLVPIDDENDANGKGPLLPEYDNVVKGTYQPLARPIFIYVSLKSANKPEVQGFVDFYMKNGATLSKEVGYIALPDRAYQLGANRFQKRVAGSVFGGKSQVGVSIEDLLQREGK